MEKMRREYLTELRSAVEPMEDRVSIGSFEFLMDFHTETDEPAGLTDSVTTSTLTLHRALPSS